MMHCDYDDDKTMGAMGARGRKTREMGNGGYMGARKAKQGATRTQGVCKSPKSGARGKLYSKNHMNHPCRTPAVPLSSLCRICTFPIFSHGGTLAFSLARTRMRKV